MLDYYVARRGLHVDLAIVPARTDVGRLRASLELGAEGTPDAQAHLGRAEADVRPFAEGNPHAVARADFDEDLVSVAAPHRLDARLVHHLAHLLAVGAGFQ